MSVEITGRNSYRNHTDGAIFSGIMDQFLAATFIRKAFEALSNRQTIGKVVLTP